jgi:ABC-type Fe3+/spermidine/putrescine transport system ATPase subunit
VRDVSFEATRGEFLSFLGPSGCGKTTTLAMSAGFQDPSGGSVWVRGDASISCRREAQHGHGVPELRTFSAHVGLDNVAFGLKMRDVERQDLRRRVDAALEQVRMRDFADRRPAQLSGGQQQRVALARALVIEPHVLLLDEPFGALDRQLREQMQVELRTLQRSVGITTVFVTHDQDEALSMSDRIAVMNQDGSSNWASRTTSSSAPQRSLLRASWGARTFSRNRARCRRRDRLGRHADRQDRSSRRGRRLAAGGSGPMHDQARTFSRARERRRTAGMQRRRRSAAQVGYHGPVTVLHIELAGGIPFVARVETRSLSATSGADPWDQAIRIAWSASDTLVYAGDLLCQ